MKLQRFEVSNTPHLTIECHGDLDISGGREGEVAIKAYGTDEDLEIQREGEHLTITSHARCKVGCPRGTTLTLQAVHGDARVRRVAGPIAAKAIHGDTVLKEVGPTTINDAMGDVRARSVSGELRLDQVAGDLGVRGVEGLLSCGSVGGDLSAVSLQGGLEASVGGDASLKTDFVPGSNYALTTGGSAAIKFPADTNATVQVTAAGDIQHKVEWAELTEDAGMLSGRVGEAKAAVTVTAGSDVSLQSRSDSAAFTTSFGLEDDTLELELESVAEEIERNIQSHMARLNAHLEAKLSSIDHEAIRRKAERAAEKARRRAEHAAERARLKAERAQRRWERMGARQPARPAPGRPPARRSVEPITEDERMVILRMVQEGKISADEAARLLEAMEG
jgi:DUF4097 and DUF4098 domain-containing protein YvlB